MSIRRACRVLDADPKIAETRERYGYRRIHVLLRREGWLINEKRVHRLYREMGLQTTQNTEVRRERSFGTNGRPPREATRCGRFVHDQTAMGTKIRIWTIVDTFSRFSPAVERRCRFRGSDVVETLERVGKFYGLPKVSVWIRGASSSLAISNCGPVNAA